MNISPVTARRLALYAQGLDGHWTLPSGKEGAAQVIERLGYVQVDTIHVIERAHHHTIWTRHPDYTPAMLHELLAEDRRVFEWWTHAMSYIPMRDYRFYKPRMGLKADRKPQTFIIRRLLFEPAFSEYEAVLPSLADKLRAFAVFNGCETFALEVVQPEKIKAPLAKLLAT